MAEIEPAKCAECGKPALAKFAPFCSQRCQQIDLSRWLKGDYLIPGQPQSLPTGSDEDGQE